MSEENEQKANKIIYGVGVSPGVISGRAHVLKRDSEEVAHRRISEDSIPQEIARLEEALIRTREQLRIIQDEIGQVLDTKSASIFDAHMLVVDDRSFIEEIIQVVRKEHLNVEWALDRVSEDYAKALARIEDDYLRERAADIRDVSRRILRNLSGKSAGSLADLKEPRIVIAHDIAPSETAIMNRDVVIGFATDIGSPSSHTAIMARALEIPAVVGLTDASARVSQDDEVLLDGQQGILIINPSEEQLKRYCDLADRQKRIRAGLKRLKNRAAETKDGHMVTLSANIELPKDVLNAKKYGANGVGLFRTEFLYLSEHGLPDEHEQAKVYTKAARELDPAPLIIRTVDIGGDKFISKYDTASEINPFLGWRGIRFCLAQEDIFLKQLRAILRASVHKNVKIMYPMISNAKEVVQANKLLEQAKTELREKGIGYNEQIEVGVMIEVPSAAITADHIAPHVDFFSIGTNDLVQYTMAVDRVNEKVSHLYEPTHPAIIRLIKCATDTKKKHDIWVGICGEMAGNPLWTPLLLGLGLDEFSVNPKSIPEVKDVICNLEMSVALNLAEQASRCDSAEAIDELCREVVREVAPDISKLII
jgi:phosphoenolpyruvate-protein phosphotransferase (PTS system enzyme I)